LAHCVKCEANDAAYLSLFYAAAGGDASIYPQTYKLGRCSSCCDDDVGEIVHKHDSTGSSSVTDVHKRPLHTANDCPSKRKAFKANHSGHSGHENPHPEQGLLSEECTSDQCVDVHRTGAKCVPGLQQQDALVAGLNYHVTGADILQK